MQCPSLAQNSFFFYPHWALNSLLSHLQFQAVLLGPIRALAVPGLWAVIASCGFGTTPLPGSPGPCASCLGLCPQGLLPTWAGVSQVD